MKEMTVESSRRPSFSLFLRTSPVENFTLRPFRHIYRRTMGRRVTRKSYLRPVLSSAGETTPVPFFLFSRPHCLNPKVTKEDLRIASRVDTSDDLCRVKFYDLTCTVGEEVTECPK